MREAGFEVTHLYGLTEVYGPAVVNDWKDEWNALDAEEQAHLKARQGVRYHALEALDVIDPETMTPVPADGKTMGEVMFRGNVVMKGYLKNKASTDGAFAGGWFHSQDLGVKHPDGYVQLRDRSKDIIISGGENISSIEVEDALFEHPGVQLAAVVARAGRQVGRDAVRFRRNEAGADSDRGGACRLVPPEARPLQVPANDRLRRNPEDVHRQGAEIRVARARETARPAAGAERMPADLWPGYCRALLASSVASAGQRFPGRGEDAPERVHGVRKTLKESRALARLFLPSIGEPARVTIAALAVVRRRIGRARDLDVMEDRLDRLDQPPHIAAPLTAAIERERAAAKRAHTDFATAASRAQLQRHRQADRGLGPRTRRGRRHRRGRRAHLPTGLRRGRIAFEGGDPAALHALRSRVVDLRYQLSALSPAWPAALDAQSDALNALAGYARRLQRLRHARPFRRRTRRAPARSARRFRQRLEMKQTKLRRRAAIEFERLFRRNARRVRRASEPSISGTRWASSNRLVARFPSGRSFLPRRQRDWLLQPARRMGRGVRQKSTARPLTSQSP